LDKNIIAIVSIWAVEDYIEYKILENIGENIKQKEKK